MVLMSMLKIEQIILRQTWWKNYVSEKWQNIKMNCFLIFFFETLWHILGVPNEDEILAILKKAGGKASRDL